MHDESIPVGICECGCGRVPRIAERTDRSRGWVKGEPLRFINGHQARKAWPLAQFIVAEHGCWIWQGRMDADGYGYAWHNGRVMKAHRLIFEHHRGPIAVGHDLHHECANPSCVNPDHLRSVTRAQHGRLQSSATKTECSNGHPFDEANTYIRPDGRRDCRVCIRARVRAYKKRVAS